MKITAKDIAGLVRTLSKTANKPHFTSAIIAAAGKSTRMNDANGRTKQLIELCGIPVVVRTLISFQECELINEIIVSAKPDEIELYGGFVEKYKITKLSAVVPGGETRQESVLKGFEKISDKSEFVAIHDGARCLIGKDAIETVIRSAYISGAATASCKVNDTVKKCDYNSYISETVDRDSLRLAQTPQVFKTELYRAAAYVAQEEGFKATDDNMLAEHIGYSVKLVDCGSENLKITTPADLAIAEIILRRRTNPAEYREG